MRKGRWLKPGDLDYGDVPDCYRCGYTLAEVNPYGVMWITFKSATDPDGKLMVLCDKCSIELGEWFHPELSKNPSYVAEKDQYQAGVREVFGERDDGPQL